MKRRKKMILLQAALVVFFACSLFLPMLIGAGDLEPAAGPEDAGSAMYTLEDIYNRLTDNSTATKRTGGFTEPSAAPGPSGHTLDQIYDLALPTQVAKTGQTASNSKKTGDDGNLEAGVAWPDPRFTDNLDGTVTDHLTGLVWLKNANCFSYQDWTTSLNSCNNLASSYCGLTDGSSAGDWHLPNIKELQSLIDFSQYNPALPAGNPFAGVQSDFYQSSTIYMPETSKAWGVNLNSGHVTQDVMGYGGHVWPVRINK